MSQDSSQLDQYIGYQLFVVIPISIFIIYITGKQKIKEEAGETPFNLFMGVGIA